MAKDGNHSDVSLETFSKVVEAIYDCALDPSHWYRTIDMIADLCGCHYGLLGVIDLENVGNELRFHVGHKKHYLRLYEEKYVATGLSVKQAAEILGIGDTTAKTHLQHIYAKTGISKKTELMHLFMSSAPPVQAAPA